jgi:hypothetical protein
MPALCPACGDRPDIGALDANRDPWAGDRGELTVAMARAWISPLNSLRSIVLAAVLECAAAVFLAPMRILPCAGGHAPAYHFATSRQQVCGHTTNWVDG